MTAVDFPNNPTINDTFTVGERTWKWTGTSWDAVVTSAGVPSGGTDGQLIVKSGSTNFQTVWSNVAPLVSYQHSQQATSNTWTINHNLGYQPAVTIKDNYGQIIEGHVTYNSINSLTVEFSVAITGYAYLS